MGVKNSLSVLCLLAPKPVCVARPGFDSLLQLGVSTPANSVTLLACTADLL